MSGVYAMLTPAWGGQMYVGPTDANGDATAFNVIQGAFSIRVSHPLNSSVYADASGAIAGDGDSQAVTITLPATGTVIGTVTRPDGTAFPFPDVYIEAPGAEWQPSTRDAARALSRSTPCRPGRR